MLKTQICVTRPQCVNRHNAAVLRTYGVGRPIFVLIVWCSNFQTACRLCGGPCTLCGGPCTFCTGTLRLTSRRRHEIFWFADKVANFPWGKSVNVYCKILLRRHKYKRWHEKTAAATKRNKLTDSVTRKFLLLCLCILIVCLCMTTLTEVFPCFFLSCRANARVKPAKTGHGPHSS